MNKSNILEYKGFHSAVQYDAESAMLIGKIKGINDLVTFEADSPHRIEAEFHAAVEEYLAFCEEVGKQPEKEYKGTFNVRITPALHKELALLSLKSGDSLNAVVEKAIKNYVHASVI